MPGAPSSFLLLLAMPFAPSSVQIGGELHFHMLVTRSELMGF